MLHESSPEETIAELRAELARHERESADRQRQLERYAADLRETFKQERAASAELHRSYVATVRALANAVEARDAYTGKHAERVAAYGVELARAVGLQLTDAPEIEFGFLLHDVGKVAVPDAILFKPGRLTEDEFRLIARHPEIGTEILRDVDFLGEAKLVVRHHHERWDGAGYPDGLAGEDIPLGARIIHVADALDSMLTTRIYRAARPGDEALEELRRRAGTQFCPRCVTALERLAENDELGGEQNARVPLLATAS